MRLTWTHRPPPDFDPRKPVDAALIPYSGLWRLDDETGAEVARVEKSQSRPYGSPWAGKIARRLYPPGRLPTWVTRRGAQAARRAIQDALVAECRQRLNCEPDDLEFFTMEVSK